MSPPVFVVDTNVLAAGLITGDTRSPVVRILDHMLIEQPPERTSVISPRTDVERISGGRPAAE